MTEMTLQDALAEVKRVTNENYPWNASDFVDSSSEADRLVADAAATILNAAASGQLEIKKSNIRRRKPQNMECRISGRLPFSQEEVELRMDAICGCMGKYDCDCVSVSNRAFRELWTEYNLRGKNG